MDENGDFGTEPCRRLFTLSRDRVRRSIKSRAQHYAVDVVIVAVASTGDVVHG